MGICRKTNAILIAVFSFLIWPSISIAAECSPELIKIRGDWGQAQFSIEVADNTEERNLGLMHRSEMPRMAGMLFVYPKPGDRSFWMKNTLIPLDMLFADKTGTVRFIKHNAEPQNLRPVYGGNNIQYVLEINGGMAEALGIVKGSELLHPAISNELAAWSCAVTE